MINIIQLFLFSLLTSLFFFLSGSIVIQILYKNTVKNHLTSSVDIPIFIGIIFISIISLTVNFIHPLDRIVNSIIFIFFFIIGFYYFLSKINKHHLYKLVLIAFISAFLIYKSNIFIPDAGLYHLPFIKIINTEKIIFGLSNLHFRFGHISIIQYSSGFLNNFIFLDKGITLLPAILSATFLIFLISRIFLLKKINVNYFIIFFSLIFSIDYLDRYSNYGNDAPAFIFGILSIIFLIEYIYSKKNEFLFISAISITFSFLIKPFFIILAILPGYYFFINIINRNIFEKKFILIPLIIFFWITKTFINSGCLIFPMKITCVESVSWSNINKTEYYEISGEAASKGYLDVLKSQSSNISMSEFNKNFNWINIWLDNHSNVIIEKLTPYLLFLIIYLIVVFLSKKKDVQNRKINLKKIYFIYFSFFLFCVYWFLKFPLYRYGIFFIFIFITFSIIIFQKNLLFKRKILSINKKIVTIVLIILAIVNFNRIQKNDDNPAWPQIYSNKPENYEKISKNGNFIYTKSKISCMYNENLCSNWEINFNSFVQKKGYKFFTLEN